MACGSPETSRSGLRSNPAPLAHPQQPVHARRVARRLWARAGMYGQSKETATARALESQPVAPNLTNLALGVRKAAPARRSIPVPQLNLDPMGKFREPDPRDKSSQLLNCLDRRDLLREYVKNVPRAPSFYDVALHGSPRSVTIELWYDDQVAQASPQTLANYIRSQPSYTGTPVRMLSCHTGAPSGDFAQKLANILHVPVAAPSDKLWVSEFGHMFIGPEAGTNTGKWLLYSPDDVE